MDENSDNAASVPSSPPPPGAPHTEVAAWLTEHTPELFAIALGVARRRLPPELYHLAEDIVQDAFVGLLRAIQRGEVIEDPKAFIATVARRKAASLAKREERQRPTAETDLDEGMTHGAAGAPSDEDRADARRLRDEAIRRMSPGEREAFTLHHEQGWSLDDIAESTGTSSDSLKTQLSRARAKARRVFEEGGR